MDVSVVPISDLHKKGCLYCRLLFGLDYRRFYSDNDDDSFLIIENTKTLSPILILRRHTIPQDMSDISRVYMEMNSLCFSLFGDNYYLKPDCDYTHFAILSYKIYRQKEKVDILR